MLSAAGLVDLVVEAEIERAWGEGRKSDTRWSEVCARNAWQRDGRPGIDGRTDVAVQARAKSKRREGEVQTKTSEEERKEEEEEREEVGEMQTLRGLHRAPSWVKGVGAI